MVKRTVLDAKVVTGVVKCCRSQSFGVMFHVVVRQAGLAPVFKRVKNYLEAVMGLTAFVSFFVICVCFNIRTLLTIVLDHFCGELKFP